MIVNIVRMMRVGGDREVERNALSDYALSVRRLVRCTNAECRLNGYRVWVDADDPYACECTAADVAKHHLALARESLKRRPA